MLDWQLRVYRRFILLWLFMPYFFVYQNRRKKTRMRQVFIQGTTRQYLQTLLVVQRAVHVWYTEQCMCVVQREVHECGAASSVMH